MIVDLRGATILPDAEDDKFDVTLCICAGC